MPKLPAENGGVVEKPANGGVGENGGVVEKVGGVAPKPPSEPGLRLSRAKYGSVSGPSSDDGRMGDRLLLLLGTIGPGRICVMGMGGVAGLVIGKGGDG